MYGIAKAEMIHNLTKSWPLFTIEHYGGASLVFVPTPQKYLSGVLSGAIQVNTLHVGEQGLLQNWIWHCLREHFSCRLCNKAQEIAGYILGFTVCQKLQTVHIQMLPEW